MHVKGLFLVSGAGMFSKRLFEERPRVSCRYSCRRAYFHRVIVHVQSTDMTGAERSRKSRVAQNFYPCLSAPIQTPTLSPRRSLIDVSAFSSFISHKTTSSLPHRAYMSGNFGVVVRSYYPSYKIRRCWVCLLVLLVLPANQYCLSAVQ